MDNIDLKNNIINDKLKVISKKQDELLLKEIQFEEHIKKINDELKIKEMELNKIEENLKEREKSFEIAFVWDVEGENVKKRINKLNRRLFGIYITKKLKNEENKRYFIDGILFKKGNNNNIENIAKVTKRWKSCFSIPLSEVRFRDNILDVFKELNITVTEYKIVENELHINK